MISINSIILLEQLLFWPLYLGFVVSLISTWLLCRFSQYFQFGHDKFDGVQKFHTKPTSRLGGVALALGLCASTSSLLVQELSGIEYDYLSLSIWFLIAAIPVWLAGLTEDLTHRVGPTIRLVAATLSAALLYGSIGVSVSRTDVFPIDWLIAFPGGALCITLLVVAGFTHSANIVDGFHGLSCGLMSITLVALAYIAFQNSDILMVQMCLTVLSVIFGYFFFNWPKGSIFLGDGGAYLIGFWVVELGILISMRNPDISPMAPVVTGLLPLIETLFSIYRRKVIRDNPVNHPDALHLHTLVYKRLLYSPGIFIEPSRKNKLNSRVAFFFWLPALFFSVLSCAFMYSTWAQLALMFGYLMMYVWLYNRLVKFRSPSMMKFR